MQPAHSRSPERAFVLRTYALFELLMKSAIHRGGNSEFKPEPGLGGLLVYAGELDEDGRSLVAAANIAGAASLSITADPPTQREAMREGVVDFVVNSLDEALRILKNEIRKKEPVSVCVALSAESVETEMKERGVQPDVCRAAVLQVDDAVRDRPERCLVEWSVPDAPSRWMPRLDALAAECLAPSALDGRRWLRLFPRYVGRSARGIRLIQSTPALASCFVRRLQTSREGGELPVAVQVCITGQAGVRECQFIPKLERG